MVPWAQQPWNEITDGLWMGGHVYRDGLDPRAAIVWNEFTHVFSLHTQPGHGPAEGVDHLVYRIPDGTLHADELARVKAIADQVAAAVTEGGRVLVRCQAGYNRSGLVVAFALIALGHTPADAVALIRAKRSPHALFNSHFLGYLGVA